MATLLATLIPVRAQIATYSSLNVNYVAPPSTATNLTTGPVAISTSPDHRFTDPNVESPSLAASRYYGGTVNWTGSVSTFGSLARLNLGGTGPFIYFEVGGGTNNWRLRNANNETAGTTLPFSGSTFDFVIKVEHTAWNTAVAKL